MCASCADAGIQNRNKQTDEKLLLCGAGIGLKRINSMCMNISVSAHLDRQSCTRTKAITNVKRQDRFLMLVRFVAMVNKGSVRYHTAPVCD